MFSKVFLWIMSFFTTDQPDPQPNPNPTPDKMDNDSLKLTKNFHIKEFERSVLAAANDINNTAPDHVVSRLKVLCEEVLQPAHDLIGDIVGHDSYYIRITSGYRSEKLNGLVGGSSTSFHRYGAADCELYIKGAENNTLLYEIIKARGVFTELIWEYVEDGALDHPEDMPKWVHVAYDSSQPDRQELKYIH